MDENKLCFFNLLKKAIIPTAKALEILLAWESGQLWETGTEEEEKVMDIIIRSQIPADQALEWIYEESSGARKIASICQETTVKHSPIRTGSTTKNFPISSHNEDIFLYDSSDEEYEQITGPGLLKQVQVDKLAKNSLSSNSFSNLIQREQNYARKWSRNDRENVASRLNRRKISSTEALSEDGFLYDSELDEDPEVNSPKFEENFTGDSQLSSPAVISMDLSQEKKQLELTNLVGKRIESYKTVDNFAREDYPALLAPGQQNRQKEPLVPPQNASKTTPIQAIKQESQTKLLKTIEPPRKQEIFFNQLQKLDIALQEAVRLLSTENENSSELAASFFHFLRSIQISKDEASQWLKRAICAEHFTVLVQKTVSEPAKLSDLPAKVLQTEQKVPKGKDASQLVPVVSKKKNKKHLAQKKVKTVSQPVKNNDKSNQVEQTQKPIKTVSNVSTSASSSKTVISVQKSVKIAPQISETSTNSKTAILAPKQSTNLPQAPKTVDSSEMTLLAQKSIQAAPHRSETMLAIEMTTLRQRQTESALRSLQIDELRNRGDTRDVQYLWDERLSQVVTEPVLERPEEERSFLGSAVHNFRKILCNNWY